MGFKSLGKNSLTLPGSTPPLAEAYPLPSAPNLERALVSTTPASAGLAGTIRKLPPPLPAGRELEKELGLALDACRLLNESVEVHALSKKARNIWGWLA